MQIEPAELRGRVLRAWRSYANVSASDLARRAHLARSSITMLERGQRGRILLPEHGIDALAAGLQLQHQHAVALKDMWAAAGSVAYAPPRKVWAHNFALPAGPAWVWMRASAPATNDLDAPVDAGTAVKPSASLWWGEPFQATVDFAAADLSRIPLGGLVITTPVTIPNPALEVRFDRAAWADFGRGVIPEQVAAALGMDVLDGPRLTQQVRGTLGALSREEAAILAPPFAKLRDLLNDLQVGWSIVAPHLSIARSDREAHALDGSMLTPQNLRGDFVSGSNPALITQLYMTPLQLKEMRHACGLSRHTAAVLATKLDPQHPVSERSIVTLESGERLPTERHLIPRLDIVYGADGRLGATRTDSVAAGGRQRIVFPRWWQGPVWFQTTRPGNPGDRGILDLVWGPWRRKQWVRSGEVVAARQAVGESVPVIATPPDGWILTAGLGAPPAARDINHDWWPVSLRAAVSMLIANIRVAKKALESGHDE